MVVLDENGPRLHGRLPDPGKECPVGRDILHRLIPAVHISACIGGIFKHPLHPALAQAPPDELAVPGAAVGPFGELDPFFDEGMDRAIGAARLPELVEHHLDRMLDFGIWVYDRPSLLVVDKAYGQGAPQLALLGLVDFAALEAAAQKMELRLGHRPLQSQQ